MSPTVFKKWSIERAVPITSPTVKDLSSHTNWKAVNLRQKTELDMFLCLALSERSSLLFLWGQASSIHVTFNLLRQVGSVEMWGLIIVSSVCALVMHPENLARTASWTDASLRERSVSSMIIEGGGESVASLEAWARVEPGMVEMLVGDTISPAEVGASLAPLWDTAEDAAAVVPAVVDLAHDYRRALEAAGQDAGTVRVKLNIADGLAAAPCPRVHTDNVLLRCLVTVRGPATVVMQPTPLFFDDSAVSPRPGDALLLKGRLWADSRPARHRSPDAIDGRRIVLSLDRLQDV